MRAGPEEALTEAVTAVLIGGDCLRAIFAEVVLALVTETQVAADLERGDVLAEAEQRLLGFHLVGDFGLDVLGDGFFVAGVLLFDLFVEGLELGLLLGDDFFQLFQVAGVIGVGGEDEAEAEGSVESFAYYGTD